ncbi:uncharacterized protein PV09_06810 [Verruconis gallopava]|uniref:ABC transporter domain-containing protein n=1 Tax=Verruconis gallopava TaxID=253628 RepID=A0A0D2A620_9PEZI|nr:uncharacterized protein PV09_06810 [Verruconis gallopava]KIW01975.1 hypothetical protein PV09_06810 [Verruconis gallopava]
MQRTLALRVAQSIAKNDRPPVIRIANGTFYHSHPSAGQSLNAISNESQTLFPGLSFTLPAFTSPVEKWSVLSKSSAARTALLHVLRGQYICIPPTARSYPYLATDEVAQKDPRLRSAHNAIQYVGFDAERGQSSGSGMRGAYLSARYESLREETDFSLLDFLMGNTELNPDERLARHPDPRLLERIMKDLKLQELADMPVTHLSNGQTRRAKIAKALLSGPEVLLLDGPFMGLDPPTLKHLSQMLGDLAEAQSPRLILSLKPDEHIPDWITHMAFVTQRYELAASGRRNDVIRFIHNRSKELRLANKVTASSPLDEECVEYAEVSRHLWAHTPSNTIFSDRREELAYHREYRELMKEYKEGEKKVKRNIGIEVISRDGFRMDTPTPPPGDTVIDMEGVKVQYGEKIVLGNWSQGAEGDKKDGLYWKVRQGQRWGVFGPNGSGKTTLISLITSDHPQTYSLPIKLFGRTRLPQPGEPGISIFDLQKRIGHSSPEVHVFFPKHLSLRRTIESAWAETPLTKPKLTFDLDDKVNAALMWFRGELVPSLGPPSWMKTEMERAVQGVDSGFFEPNGEPRVPERARYHLRRSSEAIMQELQKMEDEDWADKIKFGELSFSAQRVALFIRAVIRNPDLVVLDEAFSGMDDFARDKCHLFLSHGEEAIFHLKRKGERADMPKITRSDLSRLGMAKIRGLQNSQALIVVSHKKEEVPGCVRDWICLPESGHGVPRFGHLNGPLELDSVGWKEIWGEKVGRTLERRKQKLEALKALTSRDDWPKETKSEREARLARIDALVAQVQSEFDVRLSKVSAKERAQLSSNGRAISVKEPEVLRERKRVRSRLALAAELPEEKERRLQKVRIRWHARSASMTPEERVQYSRERNAKYLEGRPDRVERIREQARRAAQRQREKLTDEKRRARNEKAREARQRKLANMSDEEKEAMREARRARYRKSLADVDAKEKLQSDQRTRMRQWRAKQKEKKDESRNTLPT